MSEQPMHIVCIALQFEPSYMVRSRALEVLELTGRSGTDKENKKKTPASETESFKLYYKQLVGTYN